MDASHFDKLARVLARRHTRRGSIGAATAAIIGATLARSAMPESALAVRQQTAQCPGPSSSNFGPGDGFAQTFTPTVGGKLSEVQVLVNHSVQATKDYVIKIVPADTMGVPIASRVLAKKVIPRVTVNGGAQLLVATFKRRGAAKVQAGKPYAVFIQGDPVELRVEPRTDNLCDGSMFTYDQTTRQFSLSPGFDIIFEAFVGYG